MTNLNSPSQKHSVELSDLSVTQMLCEINFGESRTSKTPFFAIFGTLNFLIW